MLRIGRELDEAMLALAVACGLVVGSCVVGLVVEGELAVASRGVLKELGFCRIRAKFESTAVGLICGIAG
jgi:hypothetical protein